jgi:hypothetical protein
MTGDNSNYITCSRCGDNQPISSFANSGRTVNWGKKSICRGCISGSDHVKHKLISDMTDKEITITEKKCGHCGVVKTINHFNRRNTSDDGLATHCQVCTKYIRDCRTANLAKLPDKNLPIDEYTDLLKHVHFICIKCNSPKQLSNFPSFKDTYKHVCNSCTTSRLSTTATSTYADFQIKYKAANTNLEHEDVQRCSNCKSIKPLSHFHQHLNGVGGGISKTTSWCKACRVIQAKDRWGDIKDHHAGVCKKYKAKFPERRLATNLVRTSLLDVDGIVSRLPNNYVYHHWNYSTEHHLDVIQLSKAIHINLHLRLEYHRDLETGTFIFRDKKTGELLDTKKKHVLVIDEIKSSNPKLIEPIISDRQGLKTKYITSNKPYANLIVPVTDETEKVFCRSCKNYLLPAYFNEVQTNGNVKFIYDVCTRCNTVLGARHDVNNDPEISSIDELNTKDTRDYSIVSKHCYGCLELKPLASFPRSAANILTGRHRYCADCAKYIRGTDSKQDHINHDEL